LKNLESNKKWLLELIIFKYLPRGRRIYVSPYLRIAINPLFIKVSESLKNEKNKRKEILKAYLSLILIQGMFDLLKFLKKSLSDDYILQTQKIEEEGKIFINYLFDLSKIESISLEQAEKINDIKNWCNINILRNIFINENKETKTENNNNLYKIYYDEDEEEEKSNTSEEQDYWYDY